MALLDRIIESLDRFLARTDKKIGNDLRDEQEHLALLNQSSRRITSAIRAIQDGNLIAASSLTENNRASTEIRYRESRKSSPFARTETTAVGVIAAQQKEPVE